MNESKFHTFYAIDRSILRSTFFFSGILAVRGEIAFGMAAISADPCCPRVMMFDETRLAVIC